TVNVLFHIANALLLFLLLARVTRALWPSAMVAALFAWHPLHVESVAWIAERKDLLSTFLALLSLGAYARYVESNRQKHLLLSLPCFAAGLMAKPMLVTLPFILASQGRLHEAADHFAAALRIKPNLVEARLNVARIREQLGEAR